jgi:hypothetical protein
MKACRGFKNSLSNIHVIAIIIALAATATMAAKSAFKCDPIPTDQYKLDQDSIIFYVSHYYDEPGPYGPLAIKIVSLPREISPLNHKAVKLNRRILFDDHEVSYANILFLSTEDELYECIGSPPSGDEHIVE